MIALGEPIHGHAYSTADFATIAETTTVVGSRTQAVDAMLGFVASV